MKATQAYEQIAAHAETIRNDGDHYPVMEVGDEWRQGDVRIIRLSDDFVQQHGGSLKECPKAAQLVNGSTQGARHCLSTTDGVTFYSLTHAGPLDGPIIQTTTEVDVTHPEHGNVCSLPAGCYAFPGQRTFAVELRRTMD